MPLSLLLAAAALLLAVPGGFLILLLAFGAIGPWRGTPQLMTLPNLSDDLLSSVVGD